MSIEEIRVLINRYVRGESNIAEQNLMESGFNADLAKQKSTFMHSDLTEVEKRLKKNIFTQIKRQQKIRKIKILTTASAAVLVCSLLGVWYMQTRFPKTVLLVNKMPVDHAVLTLIDGTKINLTPDTKIDDVAPINKSIIKITSGSIQYQSMSRTSEPKQFHTLSTLDGGKYKLHLADGTKVWLNAGSQLTYPTSFAGKPSRQVSLIGEAYFEVAKINLTDNKKQPFLVNTKFQQIEVLGTHFNVSAYNNNENEKSSLYEGSIRVRSKSTGKTVLLENGGFSVLTKNTGEVRKYKMESEAEIAWKNGEFVFLDDNLETVMKQVETWYHVTVRFTVPRLKYLKFGGSLSRYTTLNNLLKMLEMTEQVRFKVVGNEIMVYPY